MCAQWKNRKSNYFSVSKGIPQGSLLSPSLSNVYIDQISKMLNKVNYVGCVQNNKIVNYADDMCLFSPSAKGLQKLLYQCYAVKSLCS